MADDAIETEIELAAELRSLAEALTTREIGAERATAALELVRAIAPHLDGPPRERWYELPEPPRYGTTRRGPFDTLSPVRGQLNPVAPPLDVSYGEGLEVFISTDALAAFAGRRRRL